MAGIIDKGKISSISGNTAKIIPSAASGTVTRPLVIPQQLRGGVAVGTEVVYCVFDDMSGIILSRADGELPQDKEG